MLLVVLLVWLFLAPLGAWIIGSAIRLAEQRRPVVDCAADEAPCQQADAAADEPVAVGA